MNKLIALIIILSFCISLSAQDLDEYFDDGGIADSRKRVKFETTGLIKGYVPISLEYFVFDRLSIELGTGLILPVRVFDIEAAFTDAFPLATSLGATIKADLNWYYYKKNQSGVSMGIGFQKRYYDGLNISDYYYQSAYSINFSGPWILEFQLGLKVGVARETVAWNSSPEVFGWYKSSINIAYLL